jgi:hypothetical protein
MQSGAGSSGDTGILYPGSTLVATSGQKQVGTWLGTRARKVLVAPLDERQWFFYMRRAISYMKGAAELAHTIAAQFGIPFAFSSLPPLDTSTDEAVQWRPRADITL